MSHIEPTYSRRKVLQLGASLGGLVALAAVGCSENAGTGADNNPSVHPYLPPGLEGLSMSSQNDIDRKISIREMEELLGRIAVPKNAGYQSPVQCLNPESGRALHGYLGIPDDTVDSDWAKVKDVGEMAVGSLIGGIRATGIGFTLVFREYASGTTGRDEIIEEIDVKKAELEGRWPTPSFGGVDKHYFEKRNILDGIRDRLRQEEIRLRNGMREPVLETIKERLGEPDNGHNDPESGKWGYSWYIRELEGGIQVEVGATSRRNEILGYRILRVDQK
jgi:hypothetical protein